MCVMFSTLSLTNQPVQQTSTYPIFEFKIFIYENRITNALQKVFTTSMKIITKSKYSELNMKCLSSHPLQYN